MRNNSISITLLIALALPSIATMTSKAIGQQNSPYKGPIIDMHLHAEPEIWAKKQFCFPQPCEGGGPTQVKSVTELKAMTEAAMTRNNIVLGVISGPLEEVLQWTEERKERYLAGIRAPSRVPIEKLTELMTSGRIQVLGEISEQYFGIPVDHSMLDPLFELAHKLGVPVHIHLAGLGGSSDFPSHLGNPLRLVKVLRKYPNLRVYLENAAWPFLEEVTALMYQYPNVYADISTILHLTPRTVALKYLKGLMENGLGKRIMFGSDQMIWPEVIDVALDAIQSADFLTSDERADILYNNAARFLRLSDEEIARHHGR